MDLFNKKKVAALQEELSLATAKQEATAKQLADLQDNVLKSYETLTAYFRPKYVNKYFKYTTTHDELRFRVNDLKYSAGFVELNVTTQSGGEIQLVISVTALKNLTIITRKDFIGEEASK